MLSVVSKLIFFKFCVASYRVSERSEINKMGANNIAIVFGPTLLHPEVSSVQSLVTESPLQARIIEEMPSAK